MKKTLIAAAIACACAQAYPSDARAEPPGTVIGEVRTFATRFCPQGYLPTNGQVLAIVDYTTLFSLLGARFGGNGVQTFALPLLEPEYSTYQEPLLRCIAYDGYYPVRP